jgi:acetyl/propionyl-CoA carboxylase alpha subunit/acetyl-CoA carboxylase carboxyltransferase component
MTTIRRLAIVNRGEPAMRCLSAIAELNREPGSPITTIALYTEPDATAWFVREASEAISLGPAYTTSTTGHRESSYLDLDRLMTALARARADAVWVGWGFVAESADFAQLCERAGITFIGPGSDVIRLLGDKVRAKQLAENVGIPVVPWSGGPVHDADSALLAADMLGYPVLVKASAGGGGRGIRVAASPSGIREAFASAQAEAEHAFGDRTVFIERKLEAARHVEVQVVADGAGTIWAVGIRDCSIQRRNQKVIEESACTLLDESGEKALRDAAVRLCAAAGYRGAGTVEFLLDPASRQFLFMEVNTRLQVEHPVTELTTGLDLVKLQLHIARGGRLTGSPPPVQGHAIEARLNAEDPERAFSPAPGRVAALRLAGGAGIRIDAGVAAGDEIAPEFDSMIAKVVAWGRDRPEALSRLHRGLAQSIVVVDGGMTNKGFLVGLLDRPEVRAGSYDNQWLDRLTAAGQHLPPQHPVALLAAAVEAYDADQAAVQANFYAAAARGRPELPDEVGHRMELSLRGNVYRMRVYCLGPGAYRIDTGDAVIGVGVQHLGRYERAVTCLGARHRVVADTQGPRLIVEVNGVPHVITRDGGGRVLAPAPAFVVAVLVAAGDTVRAGDPLVVVESMKMETAIAAPFPGTVHAVAVSVNTQVEAGAPLVELRPSDQPDDLTATGTRLEISARASDAADSGSQVTLRGYLLGYDLDEDAVRELTRLRAAKPSAGPADLLLLGQELELLEIFAAITALARREPDETESEFSRSAEAHLFTYLASLDPDRSGVPEHFLAQLREALARYGVLSLRRTPELEQALLRLYRSLARVRVTAPLIMAILDRWLRRRDTLLALMTDERLKVIDRLITGTQGRHQEVCDLAREVRFSYVDAPTLARMRPLVYAEMEQCLDELAGHPSAERIRELTDRIVSCPQPMRALLRDRFRDADATTSIRLLQARTRRFYRIRELRDMRCQVFGKHLVCLAGYREDGQDVQLIAGYVPLDDLADFAGELRGFLSALPAGLRVVVDVESWRNGEWVAAEPMAAELAGLLGRTDFGHPLDRLDIAVTSDRGPDPDGQSEEHLRTLHFTFRQDESGFTEDPLYRNLHPMIAKRLDLWRLANFTVSRLSSAEDIYLFHAVAKDNAKDERLIAIAEVRDLTPARNSAGRTIGFPHLEGVLAQALADLRHALSRQPATQRPLSNRVLLYVRPTWDIGPGTWRSVAHRLAPMAAGLGLEKVAVRIRTVDAATGENRDAILDIENVADRAVSVRVRHLSDQPIRPLTAYRQKVLRSQRLGVPYPYELIRMLTPPVGAPADFPAGEFTEYDLAGSGDELLPVDRPAGRNTAAIVVGVITNFTPLVPEGMRRVTILGDPTSGLGNLAEPECRRILAALALADRLRVPVEWFALSSGARIAWDSGTENMDWIAAVLRRLIEHTQAGHEVNVVVTGINVGAQPYWNAEATMLMHTSGILVMTPASAMVLTGKSSLDYSGGVSAEDNLGIGGFDRIMGPNGQGQYWAPTLADACALLLRHYDHTYIPPGQAGPRRAPTGDPFDRDVCASAHKAVAGSDFDRIGDIFSAERNGDRKKPFDMRSVMRAVADADHDPLERWAMWRDAENAIVWDARIGGIPVCLTGIESQTVPRTGLVPADGPPSWTSGTLFPQASRKLARAVNAASGNRPLVVLANLSGFDGSPESMRKWQLEYGAEIGRAITNFRGPIVFVVVSRYHGGAFVVFSKRLHEDMDTVAVDGSFASVIGGAPAAAVVFAREVSARTEQDRRVASMREMLAAESGGRADLRQELAETTAAVRAEKLRQVADEFDGIHDIQRAMRVGSVDRIIAAAELRPFIIGALERRLGLGAPALGERPGQPVMRGRGVVQDADRIKSGRGREGPARARREQERAAPPPVAGEYGALGSTDA